MPPRTKPALSLPDIDFKEKVKPGGMSWNEWWFVRSQDPTPEETKLWEVIEQNNEQLISQHLAELKKRVSTSIAALPVDLQQLPVWRRVRFDGVHMPPEFTAEPSQYFWLEPKLYGLYGWCPFDAAQVVNCSERLPPLGWSRWVYYRDQRPASKVIRVQWDIRDGEMMYFFEHWNNQSLMKAINATEAIEESRACQKRMTDAEQAASPLQLCVHWDAESHAREYVRKHNYSRYLPDPKTFAELHFTNDGWAVVEPVSLDPGDMMLLSKHEVAVLSRRPKLKQFIFEERGPGWKSLYKWADRIHEKRWNLRIEHGYKDPEEEQQVYCERDVMKEIELVDPTVQLDPSLSENARMAYEEVLANRFHQDEDAAHAASSVEASLPAAHPASPHHALDDTVMMDVR